MTEAGKKWVWNIDNKRGERFDDNYAHPLSEAVAEFWIRAFYEEAEGRAREICKEEDHIVHGFSLRPCISSRGQAVKELKRELLGE